MVRRKKNRLTTDALREVKNTFSRFLSILVLSGLAVAFLAGLRAAAPDMEYTADNYFDDSHFMDAYVLSTLGLTDDDLDALSKTEGVADVEGVWTVDATAVDAIVNVGSLPQKLNLPRVTEGRLPEKADECVAESLLLTELGLGIGDTIELTMEPDSEDDLENTSFTVVGIVTSPLYVGTDRGTSSLGRGSVDGFMYIPGENFHYDYYTAAYFTLDGFAAMDSYSDEYDDQLDSFLDGLDGFAEERAALRTESVVRDAQTEIDDAQKELDDARADADQELSDAKQELDDARKELDDGWAEYEDGKETYDREIADAQKELNDAYRQLRDAEKALADARQQYASGVREYNDGLALYQDNLAAYQDGLAQYEDGKAQYEDGLARYEAGLAEYEDGLAQFQPGWDQYQAGLAQYDETAAQLEEQQYRLEEGYAQYWAALEPYVGTPYYDQAVAAAAEQKAQLDAAQAQLDAAWEQLAPVKEQLDVAYAQLAPVKEQLDAAKAALDETKAQLDEAKAQLDATRATLDEGRAELDAAQAQLSDALAQLQSAQEEINDGQKEIDDGWADYNSGAADLNKAKADGQKELDDALAELEDGEREYADGLKEYEDGKTEADEKIADAQKKLDDARSELADLKDCEWYVLGRNTNMGFEGYAQDAERVGNLAAIFPIIFFLVAALACLTTMTRMVEEQRTQIGALKALGFSRFAISKKYIGYAFAASLIGGLLGLAVGATLFPWVIANAFNIMYDIPPLQFKNQAGMYALAVLAAVLCTTGAALWACLSTLVDTPANLMRPKAPKAGKRVFLEYVKPLWSRLSFTWKVTMRNLFRYQRRFWMTVIGIGGCTALIVTGFGLHESIFSILNKQFDEISLYDATVGLDPDADPERWSEVERYLDGAADVEGWAVTSQTTAEVSSGGPAYSAALYAVGDGEQFAKFVTLRHRLDGQAVSVPERGAVISEKLSELLDVSVGDTVTLEKGDERVTVEIVDIVEQYVRHSLYLSDTFYEELFGEAPEENSLLLRYVDAAGPEQSDTVSAALMAMDAVESYSFIATLRDTFTNSMEAIDYAVVIIIISAAALAFVVLYNLTNINITERIRELATLKVLGFYDMETTAYVYRENIFLTLFGVILGLVLGRFFHAWMVRTVEVEIVMFGRTAPPYAYILAAALTAVFSVIVNIAAHFKLKKVDMVESLKTVE